MQVVNGVFPWLENIVKYVWMALRRIRNLRLQESMKSFIAQCCKCVLSGLAAECCSQAAYRSMLPGSVCTNGWNVPNSTVVCSGVASNPSIIQPVIYHILSLSKFMVLLLHTVMKMSGHQWCSDSSIFILFCFSQVWVWQVFRFLVWKPLCSSRSLFHQLNTLRPGEDGRHFGRRHFQMQICQWKYFNFDKNFTEVCS